MTLNWCALNASEWSDTLSNYSSSGKLTIYVCVYIYMYIHTEKIGWLGLWIRNKRETLFLACPVYSVVTGPTEKEVHSRCTVGNISNSKHQKGDMKQVTK